MGWILELTMRVYRNERYRDDLTWQENAAQDAWRFQTCLVRRGASVPLGNPLRSPRSVNLEHELLYKSWVVGLGLTA
jgi:hypothetical protein